MASIFLRGKVYWILFYQDGKKISYSLKTGDKTYAKFKKNEIENRLTKGDAPFPSPNMLTAHLREEYLNHSKTNNNEHSLTSKRGNLKALFDVFPVGELKSFTVPNVTRALDKLILEEKYSPITVNNIIKDLKAMLNYAVRMGYLPANPISSIKKLKIEQTPPRFLEVSEIKAILKSAKNEILCPAIATAIYTGFRRGELKRLKWRDIDFSRKKIMVSRAKSKRFREIRLHPRLERILRPLRDNPDDLCFDWSNSRRIFRRILKRAGLTGIGWHTFRHTCLSWLIMSGEDLRTVQEWAGHADIKTTMIYSHLSKSHTKTVGDNLPF